MKNEIHIFDLDGCVINSLHRYRTLAGISPKRIDLEYWIDNCTPEKIWRDTLLPLAAYYKAQIENVNSYVIIATSRQCHTIDFAFVEKFLGFPDKFIYRKIGEITKGHDLKCKPIKPLLNLRQFRDCFVHVWDDNFVQMEKMCNTLNAIPHYIPSKQGH